MDMNQQGLHLINIGITLAFISKNTIFAKSSLIWIYGRKNRICASQYERAEPLVSGYRVNVYENDTSKIK